MKKRNKIAIYGLITGALLFLITNIAGCFTTAEEKTDKETTRTETVKEEHKEKHSCCDKVESEEFSEESLYQLESEWKDQNDKTFFLKEFEGKKVVFTMFFASCTYACPILVNDMKKIEAALLKEDEVSSYRFLLVSIDPERDTPEKLKKFATRYNLDLKRWKLLSGNSDDIMELAAVIGFKYKKDKNGDFSHSNLITFLSEKGEIIHQQIGLNQDISSATEKLLSMK
ncbi:MAG: SCO family protein [Ignavibacteria bacterium]|nr:SCO family protein [Ignavibacteria bacterium]